MKVSEASAGRPAIAAVLVNYNAGDELRQALASIAAALPGEWWEAVVVDNASPDGSGAVAREFEPNVRLIANPANLGFGRGVNQGVAATRAPLIFIINPDCRIEPDALTRLRDELRRHPRAAMVGPKILDPDGSVQGSARGDPDMLTGVFGRTSVLRRLLPNLAVSRRNVQDAAICTATGSTVVDWLSGACVLVRRDAFEEARGFDERYFMYWEDADLCRRLRGLGWEMRYLPAATAVHQVGRSSRTARAASIRAFHDSAYVYYATHVAREAFSLRRPLARALLGARCWWKVRRAARTDVDGP